MTCPACGTAVPTGARFCEACGAPLGQPAGAPAAPAAPAAPSGAPVAATADAPPPPPPPAAPPAGHLLDDAPISAPTRKPAAALPDPPDTGRRPCAECGGEVGPDLYCTECGTKAPSERDHFREHPASWVAGVCDKGVRKSRNEDAMALLAGGRPGSRAVLVVLDGVSNSIDSDVASLAGARAAREVLRMPLPSGMGTPQGRDAAVTRVLTDAVAAANTAIVAVTDPDSTNPASATLTAAVLEGTLRDASSLASSGTARISHAQMGDSRAYWLPDSGGGAQLTVDDSVAQIHMAAGVAREVAETGEFAHAITKWLGRDAEDVVPTVGFLDVSESGWLLVCSDGLWNYASTPEQLQEQVHTAATTDPAELALALVGFANASGGHDNITVALARVDLGPADLGSTDLGQNAAHSTPAGGEPSDG